MKKSKLFYHLPVFRGLYYVDFVCAVIPWQPGPTDMSERKYINIEESYARGMQ